VKVYTRLKHSVRIQPELQCHKKTYTRCKKKLVWKSYDTLCPLRNEYSVIIYFPSFPSIPVWLFLQWNRKDIL